MRSKIAQFFGVRLRYSTWYRTVRDGGAATGAARGLWPCVLRHFCVRVLEPVLALNVQRLRHKFGVPYPSLYATEAHMSKQCKKGNIDTFNCAQRAHQNTLESLTWVQVQGALVGLLFRFTPASLFMLSAACCTALATHLWPRWPVLGGAISQVGAFFPLLLATAYCGWMLTIAGCNRKRPKSCAVAQM